jgi:hypothetical protein
MAEGVIDPWPYSVTLGRMGRGLDLRFEPDEAARKGSPRR